jgi:hypothetical protein
VKYVPLLQDETDADLRAKITDGRIRKKIRGRSRCTSAGIETPVEIPRV